MMKLFPRALPGRRQKTELNSLLRVFLPVRGIAIFAVVAAHAAIGLIAAELNLNPDPTVTPLIGGYWRMAAPGKFIILELARCAVPLFLFLAGYHLVRSPRTWKAIRNNSRKLLLPMLFWSVIAWAVSWRSGAGGWRIGEFVRLLLSGRAQLGYFFIILIVQYFLLSRWLTPAMEKKPGLVLGGAVLLQLAVHAYDYAYLLGALEFAGTPDWITGLGPFPEFLFPRFIASFAFGVWASLNLERFKRVTEKRFVSLALVAILLAVLVVLETGLIFGAVHEHLHR
ncbi:MAG: acyltransferase, partial [Spirochaetaceae bacterium]|nr:acyltransferase [Spirochaetaceae bacterium]